ncbi:hypothetical protein [Deinococcus roseus]|uniref:Lipoprotein n=1 Tax=Deinococcus roseus TaxID=392414 RepID=A0ABQ2CZR9_9DEIO|nr:hypothetical protein [Deinococcus roseus]GGJ37142.1 hypothetical protein GCM10008938_24020 [Deinococcus roseus]
MRHVVLSLTLLLALTACTGTSEPELAFKLVVQDQTADARVQLKAFKVLTDLTALTPLEVDGVATGLQNTQTGTYLFAGFENRVDVYVGDPDAESGLKLSRSFATGDSGVFKIDDCADPVKLSRPSLSPAENVLVVLGQCGTSDSKQRLWTINLNVGTPASWTPVAIWSNLVTPIKFFAAGNDRVFFAQENAASKDFTLNAVSYTFPFDRETSGAKTLPTTLKGLEVWKGSLRYSDGSKVRTIKTLTTLETADLVTYPATSLIRKQTQLLAVGKDVSTACLLDDSPACDSGADVIQLAGVQDVTFDLNGYAWMVAGASGSFSLYRVDIVAANKQAEFKAGSLKNARGVAWLVD